MKAQGLPMFCIVNFNSQKHELIVLFLIDLLVTLMGLQNVGSNPGRDTCVLEQDT